jgi:hypothetical protein
MFHREFDFIIWMKQVNPKIKPLNFTFGKQYLRKGQAHGSGTPSFGEFPHKNIPSLIPFI